MTDPAGFCPHYPRPSSSLLVRLWRQWRSGGSVLSGLSERSYRMWMGESRVAGQQVCLVNHPTQVRRILVERPADYPKHRYMADLLQPLLGNSLFTANGVPWQVRRRMIEPAFQLARVDLVFPLMLDAVRDLVTRLESLADGQAHRIDEEMAHVTADVIFRTIFSRPLSGPEANAVFEAFARFQQQAPRATLPRYRPRWLAPLFAGARTRKAAEEIRALLHGLIAPRYAAWQDGKPGPQNDLLAALLEARDESTGKGLSLSELVNEVAVLFLAGHETSASTLGWALHLLAHAPEIQERAAEEVGAVLGSVTPRPGHLRRMDLTRRVFRETLRLFPPIGFLVREAATGETMRGKAIEPGATLVVSPWLIHRHRRLWERPDEFDPDRFLKSRGNTLVPSAYLPFSQGPRVCPGAGFATQEAVLVLAMLLQRYRFEPAPGHVPQPVAWLTTRARNGVLLRIHKREQPGTS